MFEPETFSDYANLNEALSAAIESACPYEFSNYGAAEIYADEVEEKIRDILGSFDESDCGADEDTLIALRDRLDSSADELDRADELCDYMDISITWDDDAVDFYRENQSECDDALEEYYDGPGGTDCNTALAVVVLAANCGLDAIVRRAAEEWGRNLESEIRVMVEEIDEIVSELENEDEDEDNI